MCIRDSAATAGPTPTSETAYSFYQHSPVTSQQDLVLWYLFEDKNNSEIADFSGNEVTGLVSTNQVAGVRGADVIGWWTFDESSGTSATNIGSGSSSSAILQNGAAFSTTEKKFGDSALHLPTASTGAYAQISTPLDLGGTTTVATFSISTWYKLSLIHI